MSLTLIFVAVTVLVSLVAFSNQDIKVKLIFNPYRIDRTHEYYRFISSGFIHADTAHLIFNMIALYSFGQLVEDEYHSYTRYPSTMFIVLYLGGIIVAHLPTYMKYKDFPHYNSLGASGGVSAVVFASILLYPTSGIYLMFIPFEIPGYIFGVLYMAYSLYADRQRNDNVNHSAHITGAIFGLVLTVLLHPASMQEFIAQIKA